MASGEEWPSRAYLILAGTPGAGKSTYAQHLARDHGFTHWEFDVQKRFPEPQDLQASDRVVLEWGFPCHAAILPRCKAELVKLRETYQAQLVWFSADKHRALECYRQRSGPVSEAAWAHQVESIELCWDKELKHFLDETGTVFVNTLPSNSTARPSPAEIDLAIQRHLAGSPHAMTR